MSDAQGRLYPRGGLRDSLSVWGSNGPFDLNAASPTILEANGVSPSAIPSILARRSQAPFKSIGEAADFGVPPGRFIVGGYNIWTLRATARLRNPDGTSSETVRSAAAVVKLLDARTYFQEPVHVLRYYDDAWSQFAIAPPPGPRPAALSLNGLNPGANIR